MKQKMQLCCHVAPSHVLGFFFNFIITFQKTLTVTRKDTEAGSGTPEVQEFVYEDTLNKLCGLRDYRETYPLCFTSSKCELHWTKQTVITHYPSSQKNK